MLAATEVKLMESLPSTPSAGNLPPTAAQSTLTSPAMGKADKQPLASSKPTKPRTSDFSAQRSIDEWSLKSRIDFKILDSDDDEMEYTDPQVDNEAMESQVTPQNLDTSIALNDFKEKVSVPNLPLVCSIVWIGIE